MMARLTKLTVQVTKNASGNLMKRKKISRKSGKIYLCNKHSEFWLAHPCSVPDLMFSLNMHVIEDQQILSVI